MEILSWNRLRWPASCLLFESHENPNTAADSTLFWSSIAVLECAPFHWGMNSVKINAAFLAVWIKKLCDSFLKACVNGKLFRSGLVSKEVPTRSIPDSLSTEERKEGKNQREIMTEKLKVAKNLLDQAVVGVRRERRKERKKEQNNDIKY